jgi:hypothetical protein
MDESFTIDVSLNEQEYSFDARLVAIEYIHKFIVMVNAMEVMYEPDEERHYRAIIHDKQQSSIKDKDKELIKAVGDKIESINL